jgi:hypothetical protein
MVMGKTYSTFQVCEALDIEKGRFRQWMMLRHIKPTVEAEGKGTRAEFTAADGVRVEIYKWQIDSGFFRDVAVQFIDGLTDEDLMHKNAVVYAIEFKAGTAKAYPRCFDRIEDAIEHLKSYTWRGVHLLNLKNVRDHVRKSLKDF